MPRSIAGSSLSRYASTDFESQPDPAFEGVNIDHLSTDEIFDEISNLEEQKSKISREIELFEEYCQKFGIPDVPSPIENVDKLSSRKKKRQNQEKKMEKLSLECKNEVVSKLIDAMKKEIAELACDQEKKIERFDDEFEQLLEQFKEIQRNKLEFDRDVAKIAKTKGSGDKFTRFHQNYVNQADGNVGKLKLKKQSMKDQLKRVNLSLKQKEETGDTLLEVDFQQLRIENQQFLERIDNKNQDLLFVKLKAGKCHVMLAQQQSELHNATHQHDRLMSKISEAREFSKLSDSHLKEVQNELYNEKRNRNQKNDMIASYEVPKIMDYVIQNDQSQKLELGLKEWSRKLQIAQQENIMLKKKFSRLN